jgi:UDP-glucose 4-epimerase
MLEALRGSVHPSDEATVLAGGRCLVVGGGGFIGKAVCAALAGRGACVVAFGRSMPEVRNEFATWVLGEASDEKALRAVLDGQDVVVHLAGTADPERSDLDR